MTRVSLTGRCSSEDLPALLRALYGVLHPDVVGTMDMMPHLAFVPEQAEGVVRNGGDEGIAINSESPPMVTRINTNNMGWLLGFDPEQFAGLVRFGLGHADVYFVPAGQDMVLTVAYADRQTHSEEQERVVEAVAPLLHSLQVR